MNTIRATQMDRKSKALEILSSFRQGSYKYLGMGAESIVFTDEQKVYKVYNSCLPEFKLIYLKSCGMSLRNATHLYEIEDIIFFQMRHILIYRYEISVPITELSEEDYVGFLSEMWQRRLAIGNINPRNFIRVNGIIKLIDPEFRPYSDNQFLNMCIRAYVHIKYFGKDTVFINKLARSAINNFNLPELKGGQNFVNKVFATIIFKESQSAIGRLQATADIQNSEMVEVPFGQFNNVEELFYTSLKKGMYLAHIGITDIRLNANNHFEPAFAKLQFNKVKPFRKTVSLIIKTCPQDYETIYANVKHIVKQLSTPDMFAERMISIDTKEKDFIRQYSESGTLAILLQQVERLINEEIVDSYIILPQTKVGNVNERWFGISSQRAHSSDGVPVTAQLYAFEHARAEYVFQMDSDVLVFRKDLSHSFLEDMVSEMERNEKVISVGFNICQSVDHKPYFGFENGGFVPEVRMGLFHKKRLLSLRPLPNSLDRSGRLKLSWYRAIEQKQKTTGYCSIRGGDSRSFYIHPQNYRKTSSDVWTTILDRVESKFIPEVQKNEFDCAGSYYEWTIPKRNEKIVVVCYVRNTPYAKFLRMFCSIVSQINTDWGMIIIDDVSDNGLPVFIDNLIQTYSEKITFIKNRVRQGEMASIYKAIHYFVSNQESMIALVYGNDAVIGNHIFGELLRKVEFEQTDVVFGKVYQNNILYSHYPYIVNISHPRLNGGNVWQPLLTFKKYLFDALSLDDLKKRETITTSVIKKIMSVPWLDTDVLPAIMIPIIEMSHNPMQMEFMTYYSDGDDAMQISDISHILNKPPKTPDIVSKGRKSFLPNFNKIEIDITYDCNLKCIACNRSCAQATTKEQLSFTDIENFVSESIESGKKWELITILGGEPTLHPAFELIIKYISEEYIEAYSPETIVQIVSNGLTAETRNLLKKVKKFKNVHIDYYSFKTSNKVEYFTPFNDAPIDDENFNGADYTKACWVTSYCGIGLNKFGYYGCSVCGGIERVKNKSRGGLKHLKDISLEKFQKQFLNCCCLCGNFKDYADNYGNFIPRCEKAPLKEELISKSWEKMYNEYKQ
jgi:hypothetical protein